MSENCTFEQQKLPFTRTPENITQKLISKTNKSSDSKPKCQTDTGNVKKARITALRSVLIALLALESIYARDIDISLAG